MDIFETYISKIDTALNSLNQNGYNLLLSYIGDVIKQLIKLIQNKKPFYHLKKKKFVNCEPSETIEVLSEKLLDLLGNGSLNLITTVNEVFVESVIRALVLSIPFCNIKIIENITFSLVSSVSLFPVDGRKIVVKVLADYFIPMNSIMKGEDNEHFQFFCEMVLHSTVGKLGTNLFDYMPLIESIVYWSQHDMLQLLMNTALLSDTREQEVCVKAIIHYLSPIDIGEKPVKEKFKCNNLFCKNKRTSLATLVLDQTTSVLMGMTSPPLAVCDICTEQIKKSFKHGIYVPYTKPVPTKTLVYNTDLVDDESYIISCQVEQCSRTAEYLSIAFHKSKSTECEVVFDSIAKYLCYTCHKLYPHTQCQYLFSFSHISKLTKMTDQIVFELYVSWFLKLLNKFEVITLKYEQENKFLQLSPNNLLSRNESTDLDHELNRSIYSVFFMLSRMLGFIVFYKETTFGDEKINRFSISRWRPREALLKNKLLHESITLLIMKSLSLLHRNKQNPSLKISNNLLVETFKEWLNVMYEVNTICYNSSLYLQLTIPHNEYPLLNDTCNIINDSFKILESVIEIHVLPTDTIYDVFFQHLDIVIEMLHVERRFSKEKLRKTQLSTLKYNIKTLYNNITQQDNDSQTNSITDYINKVLSRNSSDVIALMMWKLRLLSFCRVNLSLQAVLDTIHYFLKYMNKIFLKYSECLQYFAYETYSDSNICFKCNKSSFFLEVGFIKENCCFRFNAISRKPEYKPEIGHAFYAFICLDLVLTTMIPFEDNVCIMRLHSQNGMESLLKVTIDLIRVFSRDANYPQYKDMCRIFSGTLYFVVIGVLNKEGGKLMAGREKEEKVNYTPVEFPVSSGTDLEKMCDCMCDTASTLPLIVRIGAIVGHMLYVLCLEDEHHDVCTAASLCTIIKFVFFDEKYFVWSMDESNNQAAGTIFTKDVLPSLWTSQKYDDLATSAESAKIFLSICQTDKGFNYLVEEIISYTERILTKFASSTASDVSDIHSDTSNLEMVEQLSVCLYCLTMEGEWMRKYGNGVTFLLFCLSLLIILQNHVHPNLACLSTEFIKNIPENSQQTIMECINMQYNFVSEDRLFLILISLSLIRTCNVYISRKNLLSWWNLSFSSELEGRPHTTGLNTSFNLEGISLSNIRVFKEIYGMCMVSSFTFPKTFENYESLLEKNTKNHSLFLVLLSYSIQTLAQISDVSYKEDILTLNDMFSKLLATMDTKYKKSLLGIPLGKAKHVYLHSMLYLLDKNCKVGQYFISSVMTVLISSVEDPGLNPLPTKNLLLEERVAENIKDLVETTDSLNNGIVSLLAEERHMFLRTLNILLYKYDLSAHVNTLKPIMDHIHSVLDGHMHICINKKRSLLAAQSDSSNQIITGFELHSNEELKPCNSCGIQLFNVDNQTICLSLITLLEFHLHNFKTASSYLYKTINLIYKFSYYDSLYGKFKAVSIRENSEETAPPIPLSITSVALKCFHQLIFKLEQLNFFPEFFKIDFMEPYPFFYTFVFAIVVSDSSDAVLKLLSSACQKFIKNKDEFLKNSGSILKNFTILIHCSKDIIFTKDTNAINYNVMKIRDFLSDINLDIVYGLKSTVFKSDKMSVTADLMIETCSSFDSMIKLISSSNDDIIVSPELCAEMVLELIKFNSTTCFYYDHLVGFIQKLFKSHSVHIFTMVEIAVQWYCISADASDQLTLMTHLIDILLVSLRNLIIVRDNNDDRIKSIIVFLAKVAGTNLMSNEYTLDAINQKIVTTLGTIPSETLSSIMTKKVLSIHDTIHKLYINPTTGLSNRNSRTVMFHARIEYVRLPLAQILSVSLEKLSTYQKNLIFIKLVPWFNKKFIQQPIAENYTSMENMIFRLKDIFWLLFGRIVHSVNWNEKLGQCSLMNDLNLGLVLYGLNNILDCMCSKKVIINRTYESSKLKFLVTYYSILCVYGELTQEFKDNSQSYGSPKSFPHIFTCSLLWTDFIERALPKISEYAIFASLLSTKAKFICAFVQDIYKASCELVKMGCLSPTCSIHLLEPFLVKINQGIRENMENNFLSSKSGSVYKKIENGDNYTSDEIPKLVKFTQINVEDSIKHRTEWFDRISSELIDLEKQIL